MYSPSKSWRATVLVATIAFFLTCCANAKDHRLPDASSAIAPVNSAISASAAHSGKAAEESANEITVLRAQNKLIQDFQSTLLSTVLWALGVVCTITLFIAGFGWWSNFKVYEKDKQRLQQDLETSISERIAQLELRLTASAGELSRSIEMKVEGTLNRASTEVSALQTRIAEISGKFEAIFEELAALKKRDRLVHSELRRVEEKVWETRGVPVNVLITQTQGLTAELEAGLTAYAQMTLSRMKDVLEKSFIQPNNTMSRGQKEYLLEGLPSSSTVLGVEIAEVRELLSKVAVVE